MDEKAWRYGCLFCRTGAEATIAGYINQTIPDVEAVAPTRTRKKKPSPVRSLKIRCSYCPDTSFFERKPMSKSPS